MKSYVTKNDNFRNMKSHQFIFINRRPIKDQSVSHAVYKAYEGIIPHDKHPVFFLFLDIDPAKVDVNVHPTKREVRFENKELVYRFINTSIRDAVRSERAEYTKQFTEIPSVDFPMPQPGFHHHLILYPLPLTSTGYRKTLNSPIGHRCHSYTLETPSLLFQEKEG